MGEKPKQNQLDGCLNQWWQIKHIWDYSREGTIKRESWESTRKGQTDHGLDCRTRGEGTTIVILLCLTARWIVTLRSDQLSDWTLWSNWIGLVDGRESKVLCCLKKKVLEKKEKKKKLDRIGFVRIMEARRKEPLFLRQQQGRKSMVERKNRCE